ncbi:MarR family transcriptional regulator [Clostridium sp. 'White wine YQ']|uniref:MarR family transcriptional regulator n=1 Tax=Clostridium sp. 'White wine YQ' TaxID=3027474 RepID=UPI002366B5E4|nr:MarR family transcriptional regulator [Clostridium sp. 'White wine YQ']MDD7793395.1 MarR family transcriptional regulator [Clostridium sp. 'White wine YQ']
MKEEYKNDVDKIKEFKIDEVKDAFTEVQNRHASEDDEEKKWLIENCKNPILLGYFKDFTVLMIHVLAAIGRHGSINTINISKSINVPKGTVSKITRKLLEFGLIEKESIPNNKKEYIFNITPLGKELYDLHEELHKKMELEINKFLKGYEVEELEFLIGFLKEFANMSWIDN